MPRLTVRAIETHKARAQLYKLTTLDRGLQLRIAPGGVRTLLVRFTVKGSDVERQHRLPQEYGAGPGQMKLTTACAEAACIRALAREGVDWPAQEEARLRAETAAREQLDRQEGMTLASALCEYVDHKRRAKDGLPLKARTKADYLAMVGPGEATQKGKELADGLLCQRADKLLEKLTADDIRVQYSSLLKRVLIHSVAGDVTLGHYVGKSEAQLRAGWQTVADFIEAADLLPTTQDHCHHPLAAGDPEDADSPGARSATAAQGSGARFGVKLRGLSHVSLQTRSTTGFTAKGWLRGWFSHPLFHSVMVRLPAKQALLPGRPRRTSETPMCRSPSTCFLPRPPGRKIAHPRP